MRTAQLVKVRDCDPDSVMLWTGEHQFIHDGWTGRWIVGLLGKAPQMVCPANWFGAER